VGADFRVVRRVDEHVAHVHVNRPVQKWRPSKDLIWTHFDDSEDWVVYDPASADLHLVTAAAYRLWTLLGDEQPHSIEDLVAALAAGLGRSADQEFAEMTRETLGTMDRAGLVRPTAS
jgi:PqqD family protein of HPr-rel-A system